jgi:hypothetical protein
MASLRLVGAHASSEGLSVRFFPFRELTLFTPRDFGKLSDGFRLLRADELEQLLVFFRERAG